ncbi:AMP-binding protein [Oculatella sp. FACHB-28]|uniref:AMP-binding protein n=1 Tax=Oculatella sp. FACHB-28 TaxID=2692845 RepID=UPI00168A04FC|nr:AMP-binding protein [Oculatella sp. FACHB-28]MBD2056239.1 AMP-binding protein [Oculatella sp. FACHB-28]
MNIAEILQSQAKTQPDTVAIIDPRFGSLTFAELLQFANQAAALLQQSGLRAGDAALIFQPMSAQLYVALMAVFQLGMVAMFLDPSAGQEHLERCCALYPPQALIASSKAHLLRVRSPALQQISVKYSIGFPVPGAKRWESAQRLQPLTQIASITADTPALLTFTSGSTGQPKAVVRSHGFLIAQHRVLQKNLELTAGKIDLTTLPIFALANLASGVTSLIPNANLRFPGKVNASHVIQQIQTYQPHSTAASPAFMARLVEHCQTQKLTLPSFENIFSGGAPVFPQLLEQLQQIAPQAKVTAVYGSTEAEPIAHISRQQIQPHDLEQMAQGQGLLAGLPVPEIQLRILPHQWGNPIGAYSQTEFDAVCLPPKQAGEIVVRGAHVLSSYLHERGNEETKFQVNGVIWHRTGDEGYLDTQGRVWLLGRCSARIQDKLGILYPFAVETAASLHPAIRRTAVVQQNEQRVLVIEPKSGVTSKGWTNVDDQRSPLHALHKTLVWAQIQNYKIVKKIPVDKRHNAKVDYPKLRQLLDNRN